MIEGNARARWRYGTSAPFGKWGTRTFIAGLRHDGLTAPWVIPAPILPRSEPDRPFDKLIQTIGDICHLDDPDECWNCFKAAGYGLH